MPIEAVVYCRVSSERQAKEGDGVRSQEQRCRSYVQMMGYETVRVFTDDGISGALIERPGMQALLQFLRTRPGETVVVIDDISRMARDVRAHFELKAALRAAGGRLESPSFNFGESATDELLETIMAATAQYGRNGNREQVLNRMRSRLETGYWTFQPPPGYHFEKHPLHRKILVPSKAARDILGPGLDAFGRGRLATQRQLGIFLSKQGFYNDPRPVSISVLDKRVSRLMDMLPFYAGQLEYKDWKIERRDAQHAAIISKGTLARIEERLFKRSGSIQPLRGDHHQMFPLRNFLRCAECGHCLTGSMAKGKYARYHCFQQDCPLYGKSHSAMKKVEPAFRQLLRDLEPSPEFIELLKLYLPGVWQNSAGEIEKRKTILEQERRGIEREVRTLVQRISRVSDIVAQALEQEIESLKEREKTVVRQLVELSETAPNLEEAWEAVNTYFCDPLWHWEKGSENEKKTLLRIIFTQAPTFGRESGLNTYDLSLPYQVSQRFKQANKGLVDLTGESWHLFFEIIVQWSRWIEVINNGQEQAGL